MEGFETHSKEILRAAKVDPIAPIVVLVEKKPAIRRGISIMNTCNSNKDGSWSIRAAGAPVCFWRRARTVALASVALSVLPVALAGPALAQSESPTVSLDTIEVQGATEKANGPVDGYIARRSASGTKTDT
ncbi:hypothetical protein AB4156_41435, partial [Cupriavidus sp. 2MCAB6]